MMDQGDKALERIITELTSAIAMTADPRLVRLQRAAIAERSAAQVAHMERQQGLAEDRARAIRWGRR
jgi:hypothetical protein